MYTLILENLKSNNERLWFNICLRLGKIYLEGGYFDHLDQLLTELKDNCKLANDPGNYDTSKGNMLLEAFALEIQMCVAQKNNKRMKSVYPQTTSLNSVINDPRVIGIIKECGGKMYMSEKKWDRALEELFESFKNYQESGNHRAKTVLKYVILASILSGSQINYAGTREAKVYNDDPQIMAIISLRTAFENNDINLIQQILGDKNNQILDDPFIITYLDDLLRNIRLNVLAAKVKPYKSVSLDFLARQLNVTKDDVRSLLSELILEEKIIGEID
jgi:COP9 signalosome complex subunit 2